MKMEKYGLDILHWILFLEWTIQQIFVFLLLCTSCYEIIQKKKTKPWLSMSL